MTPEQLCASIASSLHSMPFDRDEWVQKIDRVYQRMLGQSLAATGLPDHPAYVAMHNAFGEYVKMRYLDYGSTPNALTSLGRILKTPPGVSSLVTAYKAMDPLDAEFVGFIRLLVQADYDGAAARKAAKRP
jgi:hypothetical protein